MKNKSLGIFLTILLLGCNVSTPNNTTPSASSQPTSSPTTVVETQTPNSSATPSSMPSNATTPTVTPSSQPSIEIQKAENEIRLKGGFISTPSTSFLVENDLDLTIRVTFEKLDEPERIYTLFSLYDAQSADKKAHYNLTYDKTNLILTINGKTKQSSIKIPKILEINKLYEIKLKKIGSKLDLTLNNEVLQDTNYDDLDFNDTDGRRTLNIGANEKGENRILALVDYVEVKNILNYDFSSLKDNGKYKINPLFNGEYEQVIAETTPVIQPSTSPTSTPDPTPTPSYSAMPERNVTDQFGKLSVDLRVYNPRDSKQYQDCLIRQNADQDRLDAIAKANNTDPKTSSINCLSESGSYNSFDYDFGSKSLLENNTLGDIRFVTYVDEFGGGNTKIVGNNGNPRVDVIDIGEKIFEGVNLDFLKNKVDYTNKNYIYSSLSYSSNAYLDHVYAIRTLRYGEDPRYAKLKVEEIITDDYESDKMESPETISTPSYVLADGSSLKRDTDFVYYVSTYDGNGETIPIQIGSLSGDENADDKKITMKFKTPYNSKGFSVYRVENGSRIVKMGPYLTRAESETTFDDFGNKGTVISSLPDRNTTTRNGFKPGLSSKPKTVEFSFSFYADK